MPLPIIRSGSVRFVAKMLGEIPIWLGKTPLDARKKQLRFMHM
jgi:hypothetical protein